MAFKVTWYIGVEAVREESCPSLPLAQSRALAVLKNDGPSIASAVRVWDDRAVYFQIDGPKTHIKAHQGKAGKSSSSGV